jgi:ADP-heptose:LPS heptosyltransferase
MSNISQSKKSFALFVRSSYGDLLMVDPLIRYIKKTNPRNSITLFVEDKNIELIEFMENIDFFHTIPSKGNKYLIFTKVGLKYRKHKYDISIAAKTGVGSANGFFSFMLGAKKKISYISKSKTWTDRFINSPITYNENIYHNQHYALSVLQLLNSNIKQIPVSLYPKLIIKKEEKKNQIPKILISVSNNRSSCLLENDKLALIINKLSKKLKFKIIISSLSSDYEKALKLEKNLIPEAKISVTPKLSDFLELINSSDLCFFGEGGGMHMAAAIGVHQVVLFGHTSKVTWSPLSINATVLDDKSNVNNIPISGILKALERKLLTINQNNH